MLKTAITKSVTALAIVALLCSAQPQAAAAATVADLQVQLLQLQSLLQQLKSLMSPSVKGVATIGVTNDAELATAIKNATGGETIQLAPGSYGKIFIQGGTYAKVSVGGTNITGSPTLTSKVLIESKDPANPAVVSQIDIRQNNYWHFNNLDILPGPQKPTYKAVNLAGNNLAIENSVIDYGDNTGYTATDWLNKAGGGVYVDGDNILVKNNYLHTVDNGIMVLHHADYAQVISNTIDGLSGDASRSLGHYGLFEKNLFKNFHKVDANHDDCMQAYSESQVNSSPTAETFINNVTIRDNICIDTTGSHSDPLYSNPQGYVQFQGAMNNWVIENNVYVSSAYHGINTSGGTGTVIKNNTILDSDPVVNKSDSVWIRFAGQQNGVMSNNVSSKFPNQLSGVTYTNNQTVLYTNYDTLFRDWRNGDVRFKSGQSLSGAGANLDPATVGSNRSLTNPTTGGGTTTPPPAAAPTLTLSASPTSVTAGGTATLTWAATNATACTAAGAWTGTKSTSGSQATGALTTTGANTFSLTCTGAGGSVTQSTSVSVSATPTPTPTDTDGDGVADAADNCVSVANQNQANFDNDAQGDACDTDDDNDGIADTAEKSGCQFNASTSCGTVTSGSATTYNLFKSSYLDGATKVSVDAGMTRDVAFDSQGNLYVTGGTKSKDFPTTAGAYDTIFNTGGQSTGTFGEMDVFLMKFSPTGALLWSTLIGGPNYDRTYAVEVGPNDDVYIAGRAGEQYPTTAGTVQPSFLNTNNGADHGAYGLQNGFVTKFDKTGKLLWSTYMTAGIVRDIDVDVQGNVHIAPTQSKLPNPHMTANAFQKNIAGGYDGMYVKISSDGKTVLYGTYLGGTGDDGTGPAVRVDAAGNAYWNGTTKSTNFPVKNAFQPTFGGVQDVAVVKFAPDGSVVYSSYVGGTGTEATETHGMAVDAAGNAYAAFTAGSNNMTIKNGFDGTYGGGAVDGYVAKISPTGQLLASTYVGGSAGDTIQGIAFNNKTQQVVVSGQTGSAGLATTGAIDTTVSAADAYIGVFSADLTKKEYLTLIGGSGDDDGRSIDVHDASGKIALGGQTKSANYPVSNALDSSLNSATAPMFTVIDPSGATAPTPTDTDSDGVPDSTDNCRTVSNANQANFDNDTQGDACDSDDDNDGILDTAEKSGCQFNSSSSCGTTTIVDTDGDGVADATDNCVSVANQNQVNFDGDSQGDACDTDDDNDGIADTAEKSGCQFNSSTSCGSTTSGGGSTDGGSTPTTPTTAFTSGTSVKTTDTVNVRSTAGGSILGQQSGSSLGTVTNATPVATGGYTYVFVNFNSGVDGWVADAFLSKVTTTPTPETPTVTGTRVMTTENLNVRSTANGTKLGMQPKGMKGTKSAATPITAGGYSWVYVDFDTTPDGYVVASYLAPIDGTTLTESQTRAEIQKLLKQLAELQALLATLTAE